MKERERIVMTGLVVLMLITWLGFAVHQSPRFAGSFWGGVLAVSGATLMLFPLLYLFIKRVPFLKRFVTRVVSMRTLLTWHIYAGVIGPILVLLHTGHKFESALGIALTGMTLVVVVSGFIGRYLMSFIAEELREKRDALAGLRKEYDALVAAVAKNPQTAEQVGMLRHVQARLLTWAFAGHGQEARLSTPAKALRLAESIADVEYAIASHEHFKRAFGVWLKFHIVISLVLYALLGLHVWSAVYFGLRWFT
jgi:hypothetical protein